MPNSADAWEGRRRLPLPHRCGTLAALAPRGGVAESHPRALGLQRRVPGARRDPGGPGPRLTHPQAAEVVQPAADEHAGVRQQHLHAQVAAEAVEAVDERAARAQQQQEAAAAQRLLAQRLDAVVGEAERQQQRGQQDGRVRAVQALQPVAAQARQRALEGVQEGAAQHGPQQRPQEGLQDEVDEHGGAAAQAHEQHGPGVVEGLLDGLVEAERQHRRPRGLPAAAATAATRLDRAWGWRPARGVPRTRRLAGTAAAVGHGASAAAAERRYGEAGESHQREAGRAARGVVGVVVPIWPPSAYRTFGKLQLPESIGKTASLRWIQVTGF